MTDKTKCKKCGKPLSVYNHSGECFRHHFHNKVKDRSPGTLCTSPTNFGKWRASMDYYGEPDQ